MSFDRMTLMASKVAMTRKVFEELPEAHFGDLDSPRGADLHKIMVRGGWYALDEAGRALPIQIGIFRED